MDFDRSSHADSFRLAESQFDFLTNGTTGNYGQATIEEEIEKKINRLDTRLRHLFEDIALLHETGYLTDTAWHSPESRIKSYQFERDSGREQSLSEPTDLLRRKDDFTGGFHFSGVQKESMRDFKLGADFGNALRLLSRDAVPEGNNLDLATGFLLGLSGAWPGEGSKQMSSEVSLSSRTTQIQEDLEGVWEELNRCVNEGNPSYGRTISERISISKFEHSPVLENHLTVESDEEGIGDERIREIRLERLHENERFQNALELAALVESDIDKLQNRNPKGVSAHDLFNRVALDGASVEELETEFKSNVAPQIVNDLSVPRPWKGVPPRRLLRKGRTVQLTDYGELVNRYQETGMQPFHAWGLETGLEVDREIVSDALEQLFSTE